MDLKLTFSLYRSHYSPMAGWLSLARTFGSDAVIKKVDRSREKNSILHLSNGHLWNIQLFRQY
jgi:hypothetical protein